MNANELQKRSEEIGSPQWDTIAGSTSYLMGLCPRCKQPIRACLTNGGKLSPARTLRLDHLFSGDVRCETRNVNEAIANFTGQEKSDFFAMRHDYATVIQISEAYAAERMEQLWPAVKYAALREAVIKLMPPSAQYA